MTRTTMITILAVVTTSAAGELLVNPDLASGESGWQRVGEEVGCLEHSWVDGTLRLTCSCPELVAQVGWRQTVAVAPGAPHRLRFGARTTDLDGEGDVILTFRNSSGEVVWQTGALSFTGSRPWFEGQWAFLSPGDAVQVEVMVGLRRAHSGQASFESVSLEQLEPGGYRSLRVDWSRKTGDIRNLAQVNRGPAAGHGDLGRQFEEAGITAVRTHDYYGPFDTSTIFPDPDAPPDDPQSYRFETTDAFALDLAERGLEIFFRLGESWGGPRSARMPAARWAEVARHVVMHYNERWAGGYHLGIRSWEIWNEPNGPSFWAGEAEQFYELYVEAASLLKAHDPSLRIGGPGVAGFTSTSFMTGFLDAVAEAGAPLDFFSWHVYHMGNPYNVAEAQRHVRALVDAAGFTGAEVVNTEWNLSGGASCESSGCRSFILSSYAAAHAASALIYWQDTDITQAFRYRSDAYEIFGLFGDGIRVPEYSPSGLAFLLMAALVETPERVLAEGGDDAGYAVLAGRSVARDRLTVVISDPGSGADGYQLELTAAPPAFRWWVEEVAADTPCVPGGCEPQVIAAGDVSDLEGGVLRLELAAPAVHVVHVEAASAPAPRRPAGRVGM